ncbi:30S ribosomal protein S12 [Hypsizygus marmoreus]|uniref:30S ribosomal protein S12 n=1 Tax=Hypsizygus marmoreus TaxID=39966 RepID=A0A369J777_HYPMA|nr:30S ribosomal protein S12 [Hypsizygus marmoreus]
MLSGLRACAKTSLWAPAFSRNAVSPYANPLLQFRSFHPTPSSLATLNQAMRRKKPQKVEKSKSPLLGMSPQKKGVCAQIFIAKPKKPNSAKRKVARVKLSTGKTLMAYIQGEGHNLQEHSVVLIRGGRAQDLPGVGYKVVRGAMDFGGVVNRATARSKYGAKKPKK